MSAQSDEIRQFIVDTFLFGAQSDELTNEASLLELDIIDSTGVLELVEFLEETYDIEVEDKELVPENLDTLKNIVAFLKKKKAAA
jgi:acyl carrier protein